LKLATVSIEKQEFREVNLNRVLEQVVSDLEHRIASLNAQVEIDPLPVIKADWVQMRQLFQNLISNALKFKKPDERPRVRVYSEGDTNALRFITVEDNGIGIDPKDADRVFRPFERLHSRDQYEGNGIGLAICQKIAQRHGGRITVKGAPGKGTEFLIELPAH
jgi:light-regulated signal transduction histidine kinase (bacteriophytochrome)